MGYNYLSGIYLVFNSTWLKDTLCALFRTGQHILLYLSYYNNWLIFKSFSFDLWNQMIKSQYKTIWNWKRAEHMHLYLVFQDSSAWGKNIASMGGPGLHSKNLSQKIKGIILINDLKGWQSIIRLILKSFWYWKDWNKSGAPFNSVTR